MKKKKDALSRSKKISHEKVCKNKDFCGIVMPSEKDNILVR